MAELDDNGIAELKNAVIELRSAVDFVRDHRGIWQIPPSSAAESWNFTTFEKYINQRFTDLALQLRERYEAQQTGVTAALAAAEKAVNAALIAAEKAVDKAEGAQQLRNEAQNEFRKSLSDLSGLMWTIKEGSAALDSLRREITQSVAAAESKTDHLSVSRVEATETLRKSVETRLGFLETGYANLQGRIWAVSALFAVVTLAATVGMKFVNTTPQPVTSYVPAPVTAPAPIVAPR